MMGAFSSIGVYGGGPERAGCGSYCSVLDDLSRDILTEDTTAQLQLQGYGGTTLDAMVASRITTLHSRRVAMNKASWEEHEVTRTQENTVLYEVRLDERDGGHHLYHPEAQQFVHDMFTNTARVAARAEREFGIRGLYSRQEHETFLRIEKAVLSGRAAAGMWAAYDASGFVRYVSQIENQDGVMKAKWIDVGLIGGDLTPREAASLLHRIAGSRGERALAVEHESFPYVLMGQETIRADEVWERTKTLINERPFLPRANDSLTDRVAVGHTDQRQIFVRDVRFDNAFPNIDNGERSEIARQVETRIHPGVAAMGGLKIAEVMHTKMNDEGNKFHGFSLVELIDRHVTRRMVHTVEALVPQRKSRQTIDTSRHPTSVQENIAPITSETKEASVGEKSAKEGTVVEKSIRRHERKVQKVRKAHAFAPHFAQATRGRKAMASEREERVTRKSSEKAQSSQAEKGEPLRTTKERRGRRKHRTVYMGLTAVSRSYTFEKQRRRERKIGVKKVAAASKLTPIELAKPKNSMKQEKRERRRLRRLRRVARKTERILEAKQVPKKEKKLASQEVVLRSWREEWQKRNERVAIAGVRFAWVAWLLLNRANFPPVESTLAMVALERRGVKLIHPSGVEHPWVLLSIIWYLTAIREQRGKARLWRGSRNSVGTPSKRYYQQFPQKAVIYAFVE